MRRLILRARNGLLGPVPDGQAEAVHLAEPELRAVYRILNFALRAGAIMLASGAATLEVESTILGLTAACGLRRCEVDVTFTSMTAAYIRADDVEPVTTLRVVRARSVDYHRLAAVYRLREDLEAGQIGPEQAFGRLEEIAASRPRRRALVIMSWAGMAAAFTVVLGGGALVAAVAFVSTATVCVTNRTLARRGIPDFFMAAFGAGVATAFAMMLVAIHAPAVPSIVVAGGIMVLVPGYALAASVQDALTGFPISGVARGLEVMLTAVGIITGVAIVLYASVSLGVSLQLGSVELTPFVRLPVQVVAAGAAATLYGAATSVPRRALIGTGVVGALGWASYLSLRHAQLSLITATALSAVVVGVLGNLLAERNRTHSFLYVVPGIMPLVPGLTLYQGMLDLYNSNGPVMLVRAVAMGMAIAAGITFGNVLVRPLRRPRHEWARRVPLPRVASPAAQPGHSRDSSR